LIAKAATGDMTEDPVIYRGSKPLTYVAVTPAAPSNVVPGTNGFVALTTVNTPNTAFDAGIAGNTTAAAVAAGVPIATEAAPAASTSNSHLFDRPAANVAPVSVQKLSLAASERICPSTTKGVGFVTVLDGEGLNAAAPETLALLDVEVRRISDDAYRDVLTLLRNERARLDALAEALLDQETLDADDAYKAVGLVKPPRREEHPPLAVAETSTADGEADLM